jgi:hypothetical protein
MGAYARVALCHELSGRHEDADRYISLALRYSEVRGNARLQGSIHLPPLALTLARRGRFDEALALIPLARSPSGSAGVTLEALCEIVAARERWDEATGLLAAGR